MFTDSIFPGADLRLPRLAHGVFIDILPGPCARGRMASTYPAAPTFYGQPVGLPTYSTT